MKKVIHSEDFLIRHIGKSDDYNHESYKKFKISEHPEAGNNGTIFNITDNESKEEMEIEIPEFMVLKIAIALLDHYEERRTREGI